MSTIRDSLHFIYAGRTSEEFGLLNVNVNNGLYEETFLPRRQIIEEKIQGRDIPYFFGFDYEPLQFQVSFAFKDTWDNVKIREICRWLKQPYYQPLSFSNDLDRIYYCVVIDDAQLIHNGCKQGYVNLTFRCNSPYSYSPVYTTQVYDFSNNPSGSDLVFINNGDLECKPDVFIQKIGDGDISIINLSNGGKEFKFTGLLDGEEITVDCENESIETNLPNIIRYNNFNNQFLSFVVGYNYLKVNGNCKLQFRYRFKRLM